MNFEDIFNTVEHDGEEYVIEQSGRPVAVMMPYDRWRGWLWTLGIERKETP